MSLGFKGSSKIYRKRGRAYIQRADTFLYSENHGRQLFSIQKITGQVLFSVEKKISVKKI